MLFLLFQTVSRITKTYLLWLTFFRKADFKRALIYSFTYKSLNNTYTTYTTAILIDF